MIAGMIFAAGWLAIGCALAWRIRDNRRRYRLQLSNRTLRAWVNNRGKWFE